MGQCDTTQITSKQYLNSRLIKPILNFQSIKTNCSMIGKGFFSNAYLYHEHNVVLKIIRKPYLKSILNQINILDHLKSIWPDLCQYQVVNQGKLVGFSITYFQGKKIDQILQDLQNIYNKNPQSRVRLVKQLKILISRIQDLHICHGDIYLDNIIIKQPDKNFEQCQIMIIDFGNGFLFGPSTRTNSGLMGWKFMVPPQARKGKKYDPKGVNAYMLGRVALQILLLTPLDDYQAGKIDYDPIYQLQRLKQMGYDESVIEQISAYVSDDLDTRIKKLKLVSIMKQSCLRK